MRNPDLPDSTVQYSPGYSVSTLLLDTRHRRSRVLLWVDCRTFFCSWEQDFDVSLIKKVVDVLELSPEFEVFLCTGSVVELTSEHPGTRLLGQFGTGLRVRYLCHSITCIQQYPVF